MTDQEMALEIARTILRQQMKEVALVSVLERYRINGGQLQWKEMVDTGLGELLSSPIFLDRIAELKSAFDATRPGDHLIRLLHKEILHGGRE